MYRILKSFDLVASPAGCGSLEILDVSDPLAPVRLAAPVVPGCSSLDMAMAAGKISIVPSGESTAPLWLLGIGLIVLSRARRRRR